MMKKTLLIEIGTEELPYKTLKNMSELFADNVKNELSKVNILHGSIRWFATPRRLAVKISQVNLFQESQTIEQHGPKYDIAFDINGCLTDIGQKWVNKWNIDIKKIEKFSKKNGVFLLYRKKVQGKSSESLIPSIFLNALHKLPIKNSMFWGTYEGPFIRPVNNLIILFGSEVIDVQLFGINSNRITYGNRSIQHNKIIINEADEYPSVLFHIGKVEADYEKRKNKIKHDVENIAKDIGGTVIFNENLLDEVTSLVEWPIVLIGSFEKDFLKIPKEALVYTLQKNQKYFPVYTHDEILMPNFIFVSNIESKKPLNIIKDNEIVIHARLSDAIFFLTMDYKQRLEANLKNLDHVLFQKNLGTLKEKTERLKKLSMWIAEKININTIEVERASLLSKCDLITHMVFEFPETQGIMGMHYARHQGESEEIAQALNEQYQPRYSGDVLPKTFIGCALSIADKIDTIIGIFGVGIFFKGNKDPYGLRRMALGVIRIIIEKNFLLDLKKLIGKSISIYENKLINKNVKLDVMNFFLKRLCIWYHNQGYNVNIFKAAIAGNANIDNLSNFNIRMQAIYFFQQHTEANVLIQTYKRIRNILIKENNKKKLKKTNPMFLKEIEELTLYEALNKCNRNLKMFLNKESYKKAIISLMILTPLINNFFNKIQIRTDKKYLKINRFRLLSELHALFLKIGDFSLL